MDKLKLLDELSLRSGVPELETRAVVDALLDLVREGAVSEDILLSPVPIAGSSDGHAAASRLPIAHHSDPHAVDELIARAAQHSLGIDFLRDGYLASVAAEFGTHAFTVEAARQRLKERKDQSQA